jgi:hypothetical protein
MGRCESNTFLEQDEIGIGNSEIQVELLSALEDTMEITLQRDQH